MQDTLSPFLVDHSWEAYWSLMTMETIWADNFFIQAAAMALKVDIYICGMTATRANPWLIVYGGPTTAPPVYIGWYHQGRFANGHYQSVLPVEVPPVNLESPAVVYDEEPKDVIAKKHLLMNLR